MPSNGKPNREEEVKGRSLWYTLQDTVQVAEKILLIVIISLLLQYYSKKAV